MRFMKNIKIFFKKIGFYLTLPEMKTFWFLFPLMLCLMAINFAYVPPHFLTIVLGATLFALILVFLNSIKTSKLSWQTYVKKEQMGKIISNLSDGLIYYDPDFRVEIFNPAAERIFNIKLEEIEKKYLSPALAKEEKFRLLVQTVFPSLAPVFKQISPIDSWPQVEEVSFEEKDFLVITTKVQGVNGETLGFFKIIQDKTREKQLLQSKRRFITVAAHQLRSPLTGIKWSLESLAQSPNLSPQERTTIKESEDALAHLLKTVEDLLTVSKIEEGKFGYHFEEVELNKFIEDMLKSAAIAAKEARVNLYFDRAKEEIKVKIDPQKLSIALFNLLDNAIRYNVENGRVTVKVFTEPDKPFVKIAVEDTGIGIPPQEINKLFTRFFRASNVLTVDTKGSGLGLFITKNIIKNHGGEIWAESELNRGTTFYFTLPTDPNLIPIKETVYV